MGDVVIATTIIVSVLSFIVAASAWKDLIEDYIDTYVPSMKEQLRWRTIYVLY